MANHTSAKSRLTVSCLMLRRTLQPALLNQWEIDTSHTEKSPMRPESGWGIKDERGWSVHSDGPCIKIITVVNKRLINLLDAQVPAEHTLLSDQSVQLSDQLLSLHANTQSLVDFGLQIFYALP